MTNADKLRSLSDEQYADLLYDLKHCDWVFSCEQCTVCRLGLRQSLCCEMDREMIIHQLGQETRTGGGAENDG